MSQPVGLMSYRTDLAHMFHQVGVYTGNILRGPSPPTCRSCSRPSSSLPSTWERRGRSALDKAGGHAIDDAKALLDLAQNQNPERAPSLRRRLGGPPQRLLLGGQRGVGPATPVWRLLRPTLGTL
jgi:hypothetical protein